MHQVEDPQFYFSALKAGLERIVPLDEACWKATQKHLFCRAIKKNECVIEAGKVNRNLYFLMDGLARYFYLREDGKEFNKSFVRPVNILASLRCLVRGEASSFFVQALSPAVVVGMSYEDFTRLHSTFAAWNKLGFHFLETLALKKEQREADLLLLSASDYYKRFLDEFGDLAEQIPNYHIASWLGITEVALSRIRKKLGLTQVKEK